MSDGSAERATATQAQDRAALGGGSPCRITSVETIRLGIQPNLCIVVLRDEDGNIGLGETFWGSGAVETYLHDAVAPVLVAASEVSIEQTRDRLRPYVGFAGSGAETRANSAVDIALWDLTARRAGMSLAALAGGPVRSDIRVYNTCAGYDYIKSSTWQSSTNWGAGSARRYDDLDAFLNRPEELVESLLAEGYDAMKVWPFDRAAERTLGRDLSLTDLREGMSIMERLRAAAGDRMDLMVELHGQWSLKSATRLMRALEPIDPYWVEDPLRGDSIEGYRRLRERTTVPIAMGETVAGRRAFAPLLAHGAIDVAIIDPGWTGGFSEALAISALCETFEVPFAPHDCTGPISFAVTLALLEARSNGLIAESVRAFHDSWYHEVVSGLPVPSGGRVSLPTAPGLGIELREDALTGAGALRRITTSPV